MEELFHASDATRSAVARRLLADHRASRVFLGGPDESDLQERVVVALACGLAGVPRPDALPFLLLRRGLEVFDFDTVFFDERGRSVPRRLVASVDEARAPLAARPGRRPFTFAELERHLAQGGTVPPWRVLAGPAALTEVFERAVLVARSAS